MRLSQVILTAGYFVLLFVAGLGEAKDSPFLAKQQALSVLGGSSAVSRLLSGSLGLRADISDGWEEILTTKGSKNGPLVQTRAERLESAILQLNLPKAEKAFLLTRVANGAPIRLNQGSPGY